MLFQTYVFLLAFLPLQMGAYFVLARRMVAREWMLIAASAIFYGWWDVRFLPLIIGQTAASWLLVKLVGRNRWLVWAGIFVNLAVLGFFKYFIFATDIFEAAFTASLPDWSIVLPIGISFYTFQIVSYLIDFKNGNAPIYLFRRFLLYVTLYPQLVAGPIIRHSELIDQFELDPLRTGLAERLSRGGVLFLIGFAKKVFLADSLASIADPVFAGATSAPPMLGDAWSGALAFSLQLYFDFSAYSDMAIGLGLMMGFVFPENFNAPYRSRNIQDFWRRWHMTLSRFFRDYVYIPLGGSRKGEARYVLASIVTMGLCGLWHGAGWTFVVWGLLHGVGLIACRYFGRAGFQLPFAAAWLTTMLFVLAGWVLFRSTDFAMAISMFQGMAGEGGYSLGHGWILILLGGVISVAGPTSQQASLSLLTPRPAYALTAAALFAAGLLQIGRTQPEAFIYFQF